MYPGAQGQASEDRPERDLPVGIELSSHEDLIVHGDRQAVRRFHVSPIVESHARYKRVPKEGIYLERTLGLDMALVRLNEAEATVLELWTNGLDRVGSRVDFQDRVTGDLVEVKRGDLTIRQWRAFVGQFEQGTHPKLALAVGGEVLVFELVSVLRRKA
jgi:hypothetical protein